MGIAAAYLLVAVEITSLLMRRVRNGLWHAVHLFSYVVFVAVTVHAFLAGADADEPLFLVFAIVSGSLVALLTLGRMFFRAVLLLEARVQTSGPQSGGRSRRRAGPLIRTLRD